MNNLETAALERFTTLDHIDHGLALELPEQTEEIQRFGTQIRDELRKRAEKRRPYELGWLLNMNFINGNQYCDVFLESGEVADLPLTSENEMRVVYNQIAPIVDIRLSKMARVRPGPIVRPMTNDTRDIVTAKVSGRILKAAQVEQDMAEKSDELNSWSEHCGGVFMKSVWDPNEGMFVGEVNGRPIYEGDLSTTVVPYFELYPSNQNEVDLQKQDSIIHAKPYTVQEIKNRWGIDVEGRELDAFTMDSTGVMAGGAGYNYSNMTIVRQRIEDAEMVIEYFERPSRMFPKGRHAIVIGEYCVHIGVLNFRVGKHYRLGYPFTHQRCLRRPGVFWGVAVVERCIPIQRDYNATQNMIDEYMARMTIGNMAVYQGSLVNEDQLDSGIVPGQIILVNPGFDMPKWLAPEEVPPTLPQRIADLRQEFIIISGVSEMARSSQTPAAISSGNALEVLKEEDDTRLSLTAENIRNFYKETWKQWLRLYKQFVSEKRVSRVVGDDMGEIYTFVWSQNDITSDDVTVDSVNEMINTPAQRKQNALELFQAGFFKDPDTGVPTREGRAKVLEIFELGNTESMVDIDEQQMANARRENLIGLQRGDLKVEDYENHSLHQAEHMRFILGAEFRDLRQFDPMAAQKLLDHLAEHKERAVQDAMALSGQGAPAQVANGAPIDQAMQAEAQNVGSMGAGQ